MAIKKCPECTYTTQDESVSVCPLCKAELEIAVDFTEDVGTPASDDEVIKDVAHPVPDFEYNSFDNPIDSDKEPDLNEYIEASDAADESPAGGKKGYTVAITALAVLIIFGLVYIAATFWADKNTTINSYTFSAEDAGGYYYDEYSGIFYEFSVGAVDVEIPVEAKKTDAEASSDSETEEPGTRTETHDGTYVSAYTSEYINKQLLSAYIYNNQLSEDYESYLTENSIDGDDFEGFIADRQLESEVASFDTEYNFTASAQSEGVSGTWKLADGKITLYTTTGAKMTSLIVKPQGLVEEQGYFKGEVKGTSLMQSSFENYIESAGVTQKISVYDDGSMILSADYDDESIPSESVAGTYEIEGNKMIIELQGQKDEFVILQDGIALSLYNK